MAGRPSKIDPNRADRIVALLRTGCTIANAAQAGGIDEGTFYRWMNRGAEHRAPAAFRDFREQVLRARAEAEASAVAEVRKGARGGDVLERRTITHRDGRVETVERLQPADWRASAWFLERSRAKDWGRRTLVELTGQDGGPVEVVTSARDALNDALTLIADRIAAAQQVAVDHAARVQDVESVEKPGDALTDHRAETSPAVELAQILTERGQ